MNKRKLLFLVAFLSYVGVTFAQTTFTQGDLTYTTLGTGLGTSLNPFKENGNVSVKLSKNAKKVTSVTIPAKVTNGGKEYKVTKVEKGAFNINSDIDDYVYQTSCNSESHYSVSINYGNTYLENVYFEDNSNVTEIADDAFSGCVKLKSIVIPSSVTTLGARAFRGDVALTDFRFAVDETTGNVNIKTIKERTFQYCWSLTYIELPYGIEEIGEKAFQYNLALTTIKLPNSLKKIGPHFLCDAKSLTSLVIPVSVTDIDGAFLHGCGKLRKVYILGKASTLKPSVSDGGTFEENETFCGEHVNECIFYTTPQNLNGYKTDKVWKLIDEEGSKDNGKHGNWLKAIENTDIPFTPQKWQTVIFPHEVEEFNTENKFGNEAMAAILTSATVEQKSDGKHYTLIFTEIGKDTKKLPAGKPMMIKPSREYSHTMKTTEDDDNSEFWLDSTNPHTYTVDVSDGAKISMHGKYVMEALGLRDFYFMYSNNEPVFKVVRDMTQAPANGVAAYRCWWTLDVKGVKEAPASAKSKSFGNMITAIDSVDSENATIEVRIYDINGHRLNIPKTELPRGIYIINGKKVIVK